ncbi:MAG: PEP-CTERM sorting domain-containing protein [Candidatus Riflebacteria bacterium]|nr:PEP-CTERM sorting domain-containing protein [Candidatus Riflebacteria bacterium]
MIIRKAGRRAIVLLAAFGFGFSAAASGHAAIIGLFANGTYVDISPPPGGEEKNMKASLEALGHTVNEFTGITDTDWNNAFAANDFVFIADQELGSLFPDLSAAARTAIQNNVSAGQGFILHGNIGNYDIDLLNGLFGFTVANGGNYSSAEIMTKGVDAAGTAYSDDPATIPGNNGTYALTTASLPLGAKKIYTIGTDTTVALLPYGGGNIAFLGWDWYKSNPPTAAGSGGQDGGWQQVLQSSVQEAAGGVPEPSSLLLLGGVLAGAAGWRGRKGRRSSSSGRSPA